MAGHVIIIDRDKPDNWEIAKRHELWATRRGGHVRSGEHLFFWQAGTGLIAHALATTDAEVVSPADALPWPDHTAERPYRRRFGIHILHEEDSPVAMRWATVQQAAASNVQANVSVVRLDSQWGVDQLQTLFDPDHGQADTPELIDLDVPSGLDTRHWQTRAVAQRRGQSAFRRELLRAYAGRCAVTGCTVDAVLEAAHIAPYRGDHTNDVRNGLLLRSDIHTLFDQHLLTITPDHSLRTAPALAGSTYGALPRGAFSAPELAGDTPSADVLRIHNSACGWLVAGSIAR